MQLCEVLQCHLHHISQIASVNLNLSSHWSANRQPVFSLENKWGTPGFTKFKPLSPKLLVSKLCLKHVKLKTRLSHIQKCGHNTSVPHEDQCFSVPPSSFEGNKKETLRFRTCYISVITVC
jgi:hypothetical protein